MGRAGVEIRKEIQREIRKVKSINLQEEGGLEGGDQDQDLHHLLPPLNLHVVRGRLASGVEDTVKISLRKIGKIKILKK